MVPMKKETYEHAEIDVIEFKTEDVIMVSGDGCTCPVETIEKEV
jgi:hypothetical protein